MPDLEISGLNKTYGSLRALTDMTFTVNEGELFGFVGSNGAGKTTTMRIALGVLTADSGTVSFGGRPMDLNLRRRVGYMPEERGLYPKMKVSDQLVYLAELHGLTSTAATAAMEHWTEVLGVASRREDELQKLSLGNQQRVQLASALVHDPDLLILDEPFSGLDPVAVDVMSNVLRERAEAGVPVIFSSHQLDLVERLCDRVGIVRAGQMVALGTIAELRHTDTTTWRVDAPAAPPTWAAQASIPGAVVLTDGPDARVQLPTGAHEAAQQLLRAALEHSPVQEFAAVQPPLSDLFRHVVTEPGGEEKQGDEK